MASSASFVALEVKLLKTRPTCRSSRPLRSSASTVLAKSGASPDAAIAAISAACSAMPRSKAGGKCSGRIRSKGGSSNGVFQASKNGFSVMDCSARSLRPEIRPALFEKRGRAFLGFVAVVIERQRLEAERADAADIVAVGVERALGDGDRGRRQGEDLAAPGPDFGIEVIRRHDFVDQ